MTHIIGRGSGSDPRSLDLQTQRQWRIPNELRLELAPAARQDAVKLITGSYPSAHPLSSSGRYNCAGLVFGSRRVVIDVEHAERVLRDDGYSMLDADDPSKWDTGDVVVYRSKDHALSHIAVIHSVKPKPMTAAHEVIVVSAWGQSGEYRHEIHDVQPLLGEPRQIWSKRLLHD